jgi:hypothetical protein
LAGDWESDKQPALRLIPWARVLPPEAKISVDKER